MQLTSMARRSSASLSSRFNLSNSAFSSASFSLANRSCLSFRYFAATSTIAESTAQSSI